MRVLCVVEPTKEKTLGLPAKGVIEVGTEYTVTHTWDFEDGLWYQLAGYNERAGFDARMFAILPGLTTEEMQELEKEAIIK